MKKGDLTVLDAKIQSLTPVMKVRSFSFSSCPKAKRRSTTREMQ
jgi:hypothetical protein